MRSKSTTTKSKHVPPLIDGGKRRVGQRGKASRFFHRHKKLRAYLLGLTQEEKLAYLKSQATIDSNGCWLWEGALYGNGYGRLRRSVKECFGLANSRVHIAAYVLAKGFVPDGLFVCHTCDVKRCFNPEHLWPGTNQDNQVDYQLKLRDKK